MTLRHHRDGSDKRRPRGQMMVLFALTFTVFMGACLLGIDLVLLRAQSENAQRAANAAALSGVIFMPSYINNAYAYARDEAGRNGYVDGTNGVSVTPNPVSGFPNELQVTVSAPVHILFGGIFGSALRQVTRSATAEFFQPLETGSPDNVLGYAPFPTTVVTPTAPEGFYLENKGPYEYKESGDAYSPLWESYPGKTFITDTEIAGVTDPCTTLTAGNCRGSNGSTTINGDNSSGTGTGTAFKGYDYIVDDPVTNTMVIKLFDPYDEIDYNTRAHSFDQTYGFAHNLAYAPSDSNYYTATNLVTDSTQLSSGTCILGGTPTGSPPTCPTNKLVDENSGTGAFGRYPTTLQFTLFGPAISPVDQNMPQITTQVTGTATQATCAISNCVNQAPSFNAGSDPTVCLPTSSPTSCASPYAYRFFNYAIIHGPGIFRLNVSSIANTDGTSGTEGNAFGIAVCAARNTDNSWRENLGDTIDPYTNNGTTPGWNPNSCLNPNDSANGGSCPSPANPQPDPHTGIVPPCIHVYGLGKMAIHNWLAAGSSLIPLGYVPPEYAGKTLLIRLYDVGDVSGGSALLQPLTPAGNLTYRNGALNPNGGFASVLPYSYQASDSDGSSPDQGYLTQTSPVTSTAATSITVTTTGGTHIFNGSWLNISVPLVITDTAGDNTTTAYTKMTNTFGGYWKMLYDIQGNANDATTWSISIAGSPLHLINPS